MKYQGIIGGVTIVVAPSNGDVQNGEKPAVVTTN